MKNILRHELFKLKRNKAFLIIMPLTVCVAVVLVILNVTLPHFAGNNNVIRGCDGLKTTASNYQIIIVFILAMVTSLIVIEYQRGTMRNSIMSGNDRTKIFIAKLILNIVISLVIFLIFYAINTILPACVNGFGSVSWEYFIRLLIVLLDIIAIVVLTTFVAELTRNAGATIGIILGATYFFVILLIAGENISGNAATVVNTLAELFVGTNMALISFSASKIVQYILTAIITIILSFICGLFLFKKRDVK